MFLACKILIRSITNCVFFLEIVWLLLANRGSLFNKTDSGALSWNANAIRSTLLNVDMASNISSLVVAGEIQ